MATKFEEMAVVVSQKEIATDIYDLTIQTKEIAAAAKAGQRDRPHGTGAGAAGRRFLLHHGI